MKGRNVRRAGTQRHLAGEQLLNTLLHLPGSLISERNRENILLGHMLGFDQMSDPVGDNARFSAAGSGQDEQRSFRRLYGDALLGVKLVKEIGHSEVKRRT
jgi:hypothetical protein